MGAFCPACVDGDTFIATKSMRRNTYDLCAGMGLLLRPVVVTGALAGEQQSISGGDEGCVAPGQTGRTGPKAKQKPRAA